MKNIIFTLSAVVSIAASLYLSLFTAADRVLTNPAASHVPSINSFTMADDAPDDTDFFEGPSFQIS